VRETGVAEDEEVDSESNKEARGGVAEKMTIDNTSTVLLT